MRDDLGPIHIEPASPWENEYVKIFTVNVQDELLAQRLFDRLAEAKLLIERRRLEYLKRITAITFVLFTVLSFYPDSAGAQTIWRKGTPISERDRQEKALFEARNDLAKLKALISMLETRGAGSGSADDMLLLAYCHYWLGISLVEDGNDKAAMQVFLKGSKMAELLMKKYPEDPAGFFWYTALYGNYQKLKGVSLQTLTLYGKFKKLTDKTETLSKGYFYGGVDRYWGRAINEAPSVVRIAAGFSLEDSVEKLERSYKANPTYFDNGYYLAVSYIKRSKKGDVAKAKKVLQKILKTPANTLPEFKPENDYFQRRAKKLLESL